MDALPYGRAEAVLILDAQGCFLDYLPTLDQEFLVQNKDLKGSPLTDSLPTHVGPLFLKPCEELGKTENLNTWNFPQKVSRKGITKPGYFL